MHACMHAAMQPCPHVIHAASQGTGVCAECGPTALEPPYPQQWHSTMRVMAMARPTAAKTKAMMTHGKEELDVVSFRSFRAERKNGGFLCACACMHIYKGIQKWTRQTAR